MEGLALDKAGLALALVIIGLEMLDEFISNKSYESENIPWS
jgi:hypothetical protein